MTWIKNHIGFLLVVPLGVLLYIFPLRRGLMLPDPLETLFDFAGEVIAYSWIAYAGFLISLWPVPVIAGLLDKCPLWHTTSLMAALIFLIFLLPSGYSLILCILIALALSATFALIYGLVRWTRRRLTRHWSEPTRQSDVTA